jgi:hypothetical protein
MMAIKFTLIDESGNVIGEKTLGPGTREELLEWLRNNRFCLKVTTEWYREGILDVLFTPTDKIHGSRRIGAQLVELVPLSDCKVSEFKVPPAQANEYGPGHPIHRPEFWSDNPDDRDRLRIA